MMPGVTWMDNQRQTALTQTRNTRWSRITPVVPEQTTLLIVDLQKGILNERTKVKRPFFYRSAHEIVIPNVKRILSAARRSRIEVVYTVIQSLTRDGRDRSLDYKISGFHFQPGSQEAQVLDEIAPREDELVLCKTSSSLFNSTNFAYLMRNMGRDTVIVVGIQTDQCVDHTVRDGADLGFQMICVIDASTTDSEQRHLNALDSFRGYCRQATTPELVAEFKRQDGI
jgi:nicotinamidase-related amidase